MMNCYQYLPLLPFDLANIDASSSSAGLPKHQELKISQREDNDIDNEHSLGDRILSHRYGISRSHSATPYEFKQEFLDNSKKDRKSLNER